MHAVIHGIRDRLAVVNSCPKDPPSAPPAIPPIVINPHGPSGRQPPAPMPNGDPRPIPVGPPIVPPPGPGWRCPRIVDDCPA
ncbi:hypothetical protein ABIB38_003631 [Massilia sp. UYP11]|uniref:hypothetical protein n=1 Tax=Massilia sp. UYP11 TaxID=1756385 RepID=UPI003D206907